MSRKKLELNDTPEQVFVKMSEGNPGAMRILLQMWKEENFSEILVLDDMNIRGTQIWVGFKDHCKQDISKFVECISKRDKAFLDTINTNCIWREFKEKAVTSVRFAT